MSSTATKPDHSSTPALWRRWRNRRLFDIRRKEQSDQIKAIQHKETMRKGIVNPVPSINYTLNTNHPAQPLKGPSKWNKFANAAKNMFRKVIGR